MGVVMMVMKAHIADSKQWLVVSVTRVSFWRSVIHFAVGWEGLDRGESAS